MHLRAPGRLLVKVQVSNGTGGLLKHSTTGQDEHSVYQMAHKRIEQF